MSVKKPIIKQVGVVTGNGACIPYNDSKGAVTESQNLKFDGTALLVGGVAVVKSDAISPFAATVLDDLTAGAALTTLGVSAYAQTLLDDTTAAVARTTLGVVDFYNVKNYGAIGDGVTNDTAAINLAIAAATSGGVVHFPRGTYKCTTGLTVALENVKLCGEGRASKIVLPAGQKITVTASGFQAESLWIDGTSYTPPDANSVGISVRGADSANYLTNVAIRNCTLTNLPYYGVLSEFVDGLRVEDCNVDTVAQAGIAVFSCRNFDVDRNNVANINVDGFYANAYGIIASQLSISSKTGTLTNGSNQVTAMSNTTSLAVGMVIVHASVPVGTTITGIAGTTLSLSAKATGSGTGVTLNFSQPPCEQGAIIGNTVKDNPIWEGIDSHSGRGITISGNNVFDCFHGISVGDSGSTFGMAPRNITISGNVCRGYNGEDSTKTVTGTATAMTLSAAPNFTVRIGNYLTVGAETRRITAVASQTSYTIASAFTGDPAAAAATVTQKGSNGYGICLNGNGTGVPGTVREYAEGCAISGNSVYGYGNEAEALGCAVIFRDTRGLAVTGNNIYEANQYSFLDYHDNLATSYSGNNALDSWSYTKTDPSFIAFNSDYHSTTIVGNSIRRGGKTAPYVNLRCFVWPVSAPNSTAVVGDNSWSGTSALYLVNPPVGGVGPAPTGYMATAKAAADTTVVTGATPTIINFGTVDFDPAGAITVGASWKYTALVTGKYLVSARAMFGASEAWSLNFNIKIFLYKTGAKLYPLDNYRIPVAGTMRVGALQSPAIIVSLVAGDYIDIRASHEEASSRTVTYNTIENNETWVSVQFLGQ